MTLLHLKNIKSALLRDKNRLSSFGVDISSVIEQTSVLESAIAGVWRSSAPLEVNVDGLMHAPQ